MQTDLAFPRLNIVQLCGNAWKKWRKRRARLAEFDNSGLAEIHHMARDLGTPASELRILVGHDEDAADLLQRRFARPPHRPGEDRTSCHARSATVLLTVRGQDPVRTRA